MFTEISRWFI